MADGILVMSPADAIRSAEEMKKTAGQIEDLLNAVSKRFDEIDNVETGTYQGRRNPAQLKEELNQFRATFHATYEQVTKSAEDIITSAHVAENE